MSSPPAEPLTSALNFQLGKFFLAAGFEGAGEVDVDFSAFLAFGVDVQREVEFAALDAFEAGVFDDLLRVVPAAAAAVTVAAAAGGERRSPGLPGSRTEREFENDSRERAPRGSENRAGAGVYGRGGGSCPQRRIPASIASLTRRITSTRAKRFDSAGTTCQGACGRSVRSSISSTAASYCGRFSRLRQSSSVSFHDFSGLSARASNRFSCSSEEICSQSLTIVVPSSASPRSNPSISP